MQSDGLVNYALKLTHIPKKNVSFVILFGSMATRQNKDKRFSDYDVAIVTKKKSRDLRRDAKLKAFEGNFKNTLLTGEVWTIQSLKRAFIHGVDSDFLWRKKQIGKAKLLYGDQKIFTGIQQRALTHVWTSKAQFEVIKPAYINMLEYYGKMRSAAIDHNSAGFYLASFVVAHNLIIIVAGVNRIDLDSENTMYSQVLKEAKIHPPNFKEDFFTLSGFETEVARSEFGTLLTTKRVLGWTRSKIQDFLRFSRVSDEEFSKILKLRA